VQLTWSWQRSSNSQVREMMRVMPLLQQQQQDSSSTIRLVMTHIMASYSAMKVRGLFVVSCCDQLSDSRSSWSSHVQH
jgi:hypothetical protein